MEILIDDDNARIYGTVPELTRGFARGLRLLLEDCPSRYVEANELAVICINAITENRNKQFDFDWDTFIEELEDARP